MLTNNIPKCSADKATLRRILIIPFKAKFVENPTLPHERKQDKKLVELFRTMPIKEAFFAWIVKGAYEYHRIGLAVPDEIARNTVDFKRSTNSYEMFIEDEVDTEAPKDTTTPFSYIEKRYSRYCDDEQMTKLTRKALGNELTKHYAKTHPNNITTYTLALNYREEGLIF